MGNQVHHRPLLHTLRSVRAEGTGTSRTTASAYRLPCFPFTQYICPARQPWKRPSTMCSLTLQQGCTRTYEWALPASSRALPAAAPLQGQIPARRYTTAGACALMLCNSAGDPKYIANLFRRALMFVSVKADVVLGSARA